MAYLEAKIMVIMVMQKYRLVFADKNQELKIAPAISLKLLNGLPMLVKKIK